MTNAHLPGADTFISLREAICVANGTPAADVITFDPSVATITITGAAGEDINASGDLDILQPLTIIGCCLRVS